MPKRTVILGGVGLIGTHLCLRLLREGHEVFCVDIRDLGDSPLLREARDYENFRFIRHNIIHSYGIRCDEIYNLASPPCLRYDKALPVQMLKVNISGSVNTLETARAEHARVVFASSGDVGYPLRRDMLAEESYYQTVGTILCEAKRSAEAFHRAYRVEYGVDTRIARIFNTYGPGTDINDRRAVPCMIAAALLNRDIIIYGSGEQTRSFCWVEDTVEGLVRLMSASTDRGRFPAVNLGSTHEISVRALAERIIELTGSRSKIRHIESRYNDSRRKVPDISVARRELKWSPSVSLTDGLQRTVAYIEKEISKIGHASRTWVEVH